jgi:hypothetical protein
MNKMLQVAKTILLCVLLSMAGMTTAKLAGKVLIERLQLRSALP